MIDDRGLMILRVDVVGLPFSILDPRITVGKLIRKSAGVKLQKQPVRIRPQPPVLRSGVTGNTLGFDPRDPRFDPWLRSLRTWPNGSGACLRNKSMRVRVLPSALLNLRSNDFTRSTRLLRWSRWL